MSERLIGRPVSPMEVSKASRELTRAVEAWRERDLSAEPIKYLYVDGTLFSMRIDRSVGKVPVLVVIGVTEEGRRTVLAVQSGDKESASTWRELFKDLKRRGLDSARAVLGIMDGLPGLEKVFLGRNSPTRRSSAARSMWPATCWPRCPESSRTSPTKSAPSSMLPPGRKPWVLRGVQGQLAGRAALGGQEPGKLPHFLLDVLAVPPGGVDLSSDHQRDRTARTRSSNAGPSPWRS